MKPTTAKGIALYNSIVVGLLVFFVFLVVGFIQTREWALLAALVAAVLVASIAYVFIFISVDKFIYSKIKPIYKTIFSTKIRKGTKEKISRSPDMLGEVREQVMSWAEDKEKEVEKLKVQENFRREFLGNLAHELKTPVFSIQGYILTLLEGGLEDANINRNFLQRAANGVERITNIIEDLDTITQLESGRMEPDLRKVNIVELCRELLDAFEMKARERNIRLAFNRNYDKPIMVNCDKGKIAQVLTNLLVNSIHYGKEGGKTDVRFFDMDDKILIEVADNGPGIPQEHLPRIFERFYRVDKSRSRHQGGSGLGLAIVKHILEAHEQTINVRSTVDVGTTFAFTLAKAK
jgi:two-component system phosphate regulon sensor histidine kinase PhoR